MKWNEVGMKNNRGTIVLRVLSYMCVMRYKNVECSIYMMENGKQISVLLRLENKTCLLKLEALTEFFFTIYIYFQEPEPTQGSAL